MEEKLRTAGATAAVATEREENRKLAVYGGLTGSIIVVDQITKVAAQQNLPPYDPVPVLGEFFRLTFIYNPGAAFGLHVGPMSRYIFLGLTVACVTVLYFWFRTTPPADKLKVRLSGLSSSWRKLGFAWTATSRNGSGCRGRGSSS